MISARAGRGKDKGEGLKREKGYVSIKGASEDPDKNIS
jgi:hypothetical protein